MEASRRRAAWAFLATLGLVACAFVGRAVLSADDGSMMMADTLGFVVKGRFESANMPPARVEPFVPPAPAFRSPYGVLPSLVLLPPVALAWALRHLVGAAGADAIASLAWVAGALLASLSFLRLARALKSGVSPLWLPAFLGGTFLWAYVADSYIETYTAAAFGFAGAAILRERERPAVLAGLAVAAGVAFGCWLRPVDWITAPGFVLAALVAWKARPDAGRRGAWLLAWLVGGLALHLLFNRLRNGTIFDFGYGYTGSLPFNRAPLSGILDALVLPGRGLLLYAPIVLAAVAMARRLSWGARLLCIGVPLELLLVTARWYGWHGGSCWGPRYLIPVLPLLVAPAVLAPRRLAAPLLALGLLVNLPGVLVAAGAWQAYVERLAPPPGARWPVPGGDRVSEVAYLSPLYGHPWLLARDLDGPALPAPWLARGAREGMAPPSAAACVSPWTLRRALGLPPVPPFLPRLLVRAAASYLARGRPADAARFARAALSLEPRERDAPRILAAAGAAGGAPGSPP